MNGKTPWYAAIVVAILQAVATQYPQLQHVLQEAINVLVVLWFGHVATALSHANEQRAEANERNGNGGTQNG